MLGDLCEREEAERRMLAQLGLSLVKGSTCDGVHFMSIRAVGE